MKTAKRSSHILIAGAGIAGLTSALAFARRGFAVSVFEKAPAIDEIGAGLQLSPNATRILERLGVLDRLSATAVRPEAIVLRDARSGRELARVPLGRAAELRWGAPYLTAHRADLQGALLDSARADGGIRLTTGAAVRDAAVHTAGVTASIEEEARLGKVRGDLLVAADGVWSTMRRKRLDGMDHAFSGLVAWRATLPARDAAQAFGGDLLAADTVTAFLARRLHLVAYPLRGGSAINLVAIMRGAPLSQDWAAEADQRRLREGLATVSRQLGALADIAAPWSAWPLHVVDPKGPWSDGAGIVLVGDAAHAATPFAAQGAAMAIEDAEVLASLVARRPDDLSGALAAYEAERRPRVLAVARRGALNRLAWHAAGPVAIVRNLVLRARSPERLAADLDWLYGWDLAGESGTV